MKLIDNRSKVNDQNEYEMTNDRSALVEACTLTVTRHPHSLNVAANIPIILEADTLSHDYAFNE